MKKRVLVIEHSLPFYHPPCWALIGSHPEIDLTVVHGTDFFTGPKGVPEGKYDRTMPFRVVTGTTAKNICGKTVLWHSAALRLVKQEHFDVVIHQFEIKFLSLWTTRAIVKRKGGKFIMWGIGQSLKPTPMLDIIRRVAAMCADALLFYAEVNKEKYVHMGLDPQRMFVAHNSIDLQPINKALTDWSGPRVEVFKQEHNLGSGPVLIHVGRLMARKRLDLLVGVTTLLKREYPNIKVVLVGDGPEEEKLKEMVRASFLENHFRFPGAISGEEDLAPWFLSSDIVVAPAQIGHLATHAHAYGRPLVVSANRKVQGPEIGILIPEKTGVVYRHKDVADLVRVIRGLIEDPTKRNQMGIEARRRASEYCGVPKMANGFVEAISYVTGAHLQKFGVAGHN